MATRSRDGSAEEPVTPKDRRLPLSIVVFNAPTQIPAAPRMLTVVEAGATIGLYFVCPTPFFDPGNRTICIAGREYPMERVHYWERSKMAKNIDTTPVVPNFHIGKR